MPSLIDLTDKTFGKLTVLKRSKNRFCGNTPIVYWECRCECGKLKEIAGGALRGNATKSCGCSSTDGIKAMLARRGQGKPNGKCKECKKKVDRNRQYCSQRCYWKALRFREARKCQQCGNKFEARKKQQKKFCSRKCSTEYRSDPFKVYINQLKSRYKKHRTKSTEVKGRVTVTHEYLRKIWNQQSGVCPYCGVEMTLMKFRSNAQKSPYQASVDRIDGSRGYIEGNIRFISMIANYARNSFSDNVVVDFCKKVVSYRYNGQ